MQHSWHAPQLAQQFLRIAQLGQHFVHAVQSVQQFAQPEQVVQHSLQKSQGQLAQHSPQHEGGGDEEPHPPLLPDTLTPSASVPESLSHRVEW